MPVCSSTSRLILVYQGHRMRSESVQSVLYMPKIVLSEAVYDVEPNGVQWLLLHHEPYA